MNPSRTGKLSQTPRGALTLATGQVAGFLIGIAGSVFLARLLGPEGRGTFELLVLFPNLAVLLLRGGVSTGAVFYAGADDEARRRFGGTAMALTVALGILGTAIGCGLAAFGPVLPVPRNLLVASFVVFPFFLWISNARELLNGLGRFATNAISIVSERALLTALLASAFVLGIHNLSSLYGMYLISIISIATLLWIQLGITPRIAPDGRPGALLSYGLRASLAPLAMFLHLRTDQFVLGIWAPGATLGWYVAAMTISEVFMPLPDAIYSALYPRLMRAGDADRKVLAARSARLATTGLFVVACGVALVAAPAIRLLFGTAFIPAIAFLPFLIPARLLQSCGYVLRSALLAEGKPLLASGLTTAGLVVNVICLAVWVPEHGALGAAWATLVSCTVEYALTLGTASSRLGCSPLALLIPRRGDLSGCQTATSRPSE